MPFAKGYTPANFKDLSGQRFGMLAVVRRNGLSRHMSAWLCRCDCGKELPKVSSRALKEGQYSCGCVNRTHGMRQARVYGVWNQMIQRCTNPKQESFERYGGRGIKVCERWQTFENFLADMGEPPPGHSIERKDNDAGYEPGNCEWIPFVKQAQNRRTTVHIEVGGEKMCISEAARRLNVPRSSLARWHKNGDTARLSGLAS